MKSEELVFRKDTMTDNPIYFTLEHRLGNCIYELSSILGIGYHNNRTVIFGDNSELQNLMQIFPKLDVNVGQIPENHTRFWERGYNLFDKRMFNLPKVEGLRIKQCLFSFKYFEDIFELLYEKIYSHWNTALLENAQIFINRVKTVYAQERKLAQSEAVTAVCVHVRRGDFLSKGSANKRCVVGQADILHAMDYMENKFSHTVFIMASNDMDWCRQNFNRNNVYFTNFTSANQDFTLMSHCDHLIMSVGTYGWWAGTFTAYRGGIVMYYQHKYYPNNVLFKTCNRHEHFPPDWLAYTNDTIIRSRDLDSGCY